MQRHRRSIPTPKNLSPRSRELWEALVPAQCASPGRVALLQSGLEALDVADKARDQIARDGLISAAKKGKMAHANPLLAIEHRARATFTRIFRMLRLDFDPDVDGSG